MKKTTTTTSIVRQGREEDRDRDAKKKKKNKQCIPLGSCMLASELRRIFGRRFNSPHPKSNFSGGEKR